MRTFGKMVLAMGLVALLTAPAMAQGRGGFGMGGGAFFLMAPNVQKDLKLTDEQVAKVPETLRAVREKHADDYAALRDASPEERQAKMRTLNEKVSDEVKKDLALSSEQSKRYDQISLQTRGLQAFADPSVASKLKLTDDQKSKIREIAEAGRGSFAGAFNKDASEEERAAARQKMAATQKDNLAKAQALLTDDQKKEWKELTGEPIQVQYPARRPGN
jgi:Spy/CpxP family protein refolding chaperone